MTDLRTRLSLPTLMNLAELRLHLRDEHIHNNVKERLKRHFGDRAIVPLMHESAISEATASLQIEGGELYWYLTNVTTNLGTAPQMISLQSHSSLCGAFGDLIRCHWNENINLLNGPVFLSVIKVKLESLFDFSLSYWQK